MLSSVLRSIKALFRALDMMRLPPSRTVFPSGLNVFALSGLLIVSILFVFSREVVAGSGTDVAASVIINVIAGIVFFVVGFFLRFFVRGRNADSQTRQTAVWLFIYWIISIVIVDFTDVPLILSTNFSLSYYVFFQFPTKVIGPLLSIDVEIPSWLIDVLRAVLVSLIGWALLAVKTKRQAPNIALRMMFATWEFPVYVTINSVLVLAAILSPY